MTRSHNQLLLVLYKYPTIIEHLLEDTWCCINVVGSQSKSKVIAIVASATNKKLCSLETHLYCGCASRTLIFTCNFIMKRVVCMKRAVMQCLVNFLIHIFRQNASSPLFLFSGLPTNPICLCLSDGGWGWDIRLLSDIPLGPGSVKLNEVWTDPDSWCQPHNYPNVCSCESSMCIIKDIYSSTYTTVTYLSKANRDSRK